MTAWRSTIWGESIVWRGNQTGSLAVNPRGPSADCEWPPIVIFCREKLSTTSGMGVSGVGIVGLESGLVLTKNEEIRVSRCGRIRLL
jgi:hypothetical protein